MDHRMTAPLFVFDLDNTLYPKELPIWQMVDDRIEQYVIEKLRTDRDTARRIRMHFLSRFGSTLRGLMRHHGVLPAEYLEYIHDVPIPEIVPRRPELLEMLSGLPGRCVVFTNGSKEYARRVLAALGVADRMEAVYGIEFMEYIAKPSPYPYRKLLRVTDTRPEDSLICDDRRRNLLPARELGMFTVLVGGNGEEPPASPEGDRPEESFRPHAVVGDVCDLPDVLHGFPPLARGNGGDEGGA
ncbi:MAG: pyrimidine 5-nucleotidase [Deltaproteobacteria bacterium]|nr:pyrimidine 5-nucleotidase [Deltaproteobacteria bacterium]